MGMLDGSTTASGITTPGEDIWGNKTLDRKRKCEESHDEAMIDLARTVKEVFCEMKTQGTGISSCHLRRGGRNYLMTDIVFGVPGIRALLKKRSKRLNLVMTDLKSVEDQIKEVEENIHQHEMQQETSNSNNNN